MMQNFCRRCGCEVFFLDQVGMVEEGEIVCVSCIEDADREVEAYMRTEEFKLECEINSMMKEDHEKWKNQKSL